MPFSVQRSYLFVQPFHQNFWAWLEFFFFDYKLWAWLKIQGFWDFWVLNVDLHVWKNYSSILSNNLQFTHHFWKSHFWELFKLSLVKIKMGIYSEDLLGRNSRWLFSVIVIGRGNFEKITQITITLNGDSNQITITKNHQKSWFLVKWSPIINTLVKSPEASGNTGDYPTSKNRTRKKFAGYWWSAIIRLGIVIFGDFWWSWFDWNHHCRWSWFEWFFFSKMSLSISITLNNGIGLHAMKSQNELKRRREEEGKKGIRREEEWERAPHVGAANSWETLASLVHRYIIPNRWAGKKLLWGILEMTERWISQILGSFLH